VNAYTFPDAPRRVYWELTRACDLACRHCRAAAIPGRSCDELTTAECRTVLEHLAEARPAPHVILTGGDPLKRPDLLDIVRAARGCGLDVAIAPSATVALTADLARAFKSAGVSAMSLSLDGPTAAHHDGLRGVLGCFGWTLAAAAYVVNAGIPLQINTLVTADTEPNLEDIARLVGRLGANRWSLFFLVNVGRGRTLRSLKPRECEQRLRWLATWADRWSFSVSTTEAPHYRRILIQTLRAAGRTGVDISASPTARSFGIRDGNGIMFIAANGDVTPSGFLPLVAGNVRTMNPLTIYRDADLFRALRLPELFGGRCGTCEYRAVCGGSRARAWAATGDVMGEDPLCDWQRATAA
jgi:AdoMet-dependent heme synthase